MKLATQDKDFFPENILEKFEAIKSFGFDAYEIDGKQLINNFTAVKLAIKETGITVSTACGGYEGWIGDFDENKRRQGIKQISEILKHLSEIGGNGIVVPAAWGMFSKRLPPHVPPRSEEEDRIALLNSLSQINRVAMETDTLLYLEPLNRYEDHMINKLAEGVSLIEEGGFSNVKIIADFYHMNIEEANISRSIINAKKHIGHIHLADSHRFQPGDGHLDFLSGFKALKSIGYEEYLAFECRVLGENQEEEYKKSVSYIKSLIEKA